MYDPDVDYIDLNFMESITGRESNLDDEIMDRNRAAIDTVSRFLGKPLTFFKGDLLVIPF